MASPSHHHRHRRRPSSSPLVSSSSSSSSSSYYSSAALRVASYALTLHLVAGRWSPAAASSLRGGVVVAVGGGGDDINNGGSAPPPPSSAEGGVIPAAGDADVYVHGDWDVDGDVDGDVGRDVDWDVDRDADGHGPNDRVLVPKGYEGFDDGAATSAESSEERRRKYRRPASAAADIFSSVKNRENGGNETRRPCDMFSMQPHVPMKMSPRVGLSTASRQCQGGYAGGEYPCSRVDLLSFVPISGLYRSLTRSSGVVNDVWGWAGGGKEFALVGLETGTAFVDVTDPVRPRYVGALEGTGGRSSLWRDIKVYEDHALIVSEASGHGMQVFDLTNLLSAASSSPESFDVTAAYDGFGSAHNIVVNEDSGYAYAVGSERCSGGLLRIDVRDPTDPRSAGCYSDDGYTHDAHCVTYDGPDVRYKGDEICFACNTDAVAIVDVDDGRMRMISRTTYGGVSYTHQGWLTEDHRRFVFGDEGDELDGSRTTTYIMDVTDLDNPRMLDKHVHRTRSVDHNQYVLGNYTFQANYDSGLRILSLSDVANGRLTEVGYFDIAPGSDSTNMNGAWSVYPYFPSGTVVVSGTVQGLYVLSPDVLKVPENRYGGGKESVVLYADRFDDASAGLSSARAIRRRRAPRTIKGARGAYVGRIVVPPGPRIGRAVADVDAFPIGGRGVRELSLSALLGLRRLPKGNVLFRLGVAYDDGTEEVGDWVRVLRTARKRYMTYRAVVDVPRGAENVSGVRVEVRCSASGMGQQIMFISSVEVQVVEG